MKPDARFPAPTLAGTLSCSLLAIWPRAAPCGEVQVGHSAPLLEAMGSVCVWEKTGPLRTTNWLVVPATTATPKSSANTNSLVPPGSYFGLWGWRGLRVPSVPSSPCRVPAIANPGPGSSQEPSQTALLQGHGPAQAACWVSLWPDGTLACRTQRICWNTWRKGLLSSSACKDLNQTEARIRL